MHSSFASMFSFLFFIFFCVNGVSDFKNRTPITLANNKSISLFTHEKNVSLNQPSTGVLTIPAKHFLKVENTLFSHASITIEKFQSIVAPYFRSHLAWAFSHVFSSSNDIHVGKRKCLCLRNSNEPYGTSPCHGIERRAPQTKDFLHSFESVTKSLFKYLANSRIKAVTIRDTAKSVVQYIHDFIGIIRSTLASHFKRNVNSRLNAHFHAPCNECEVISPKLKWNQTIPSNAQLLQPTKSLSENTSKVVMNHEKYLFKSEKRLSLVLMPIPFYQLHFQPLFPTNNSLNVQDSMCY